MNKITVFSLVLLTLIGGGMASNPTEDLVNTYNSNTEEVPSPITSLINGETVNVHFDTDIDEFNVTENASTIGVKMADNKMKNLTTEGYNKSTLDIYVEEENIDQLKNASNPIQKSADMVRTGEIRYETHSIGTTVKTTAMEIGLELFNIFT